MVQKGHFATHENYSRFNDSMSCNYTENNGKIAFLGILTLKVDSWACQKCFNLIREVLRFDLDTFYFKNKP